MSCYIFKNTYISEISKNPEWGTFITPDADLETLNDPNDKYNIPVPCGVKANFDQFTGMNPAFDTIAKKIAPQKQAFKFEDQCSGKYYFSTKMASIFSRSTFDDAGSL